MSFSHPLELLSYYIYLLNLLLVTTFSWPNRSDEQLKEITCQNNLPKIYLKNIFASHF